LAAALYCFNEFFMDILSFLKVAARDPWHVGAVMPSSSFAVRKIMRCVPKDTRAILEYGPGDGVLTRELLKILPADGRLLAIETNQEFIDSLRLIDDSRLTVIHGDARLAEEYAQKKGWAEFDLAVSGIPFSLIPSDERTELVYKTRGLLRRGGIFVVYQTSALMRPYLKRMFSVRTLITLLNVPPYFIMRAARRD
jgi:phosphatidylethanolamine/phosphatidyl-N-methylethanolamine N-methyltransferase